MAPFLFLSLITINWNEILAPLATYGLLSDIRPGTTSWLSGQMSQVATKLCPSASTGPHVAGGQTCYFVCVSFPFKGFEIV